MRPRVVIPLTIVAALVLALLLDLHYRNTPVRNIPSEPAPTAAEPVHNDEAQSGSPPAAPAPEATASEAQAQDDDDVALSPAEKQEAYVTDRISELERLGMTDSPDSLVTITSELTNRDPRIRVAAREAAIQYGSRDAIPALYDAISQTDDPAEKAALLKAAEFLNLPKFSADGR